MYYAFLTHLLCKHTMALHYDNGYPVDPRLSAVKFKRKRPAGRPKKIGPALAREPPETVGAEGGVREHGDDEDAGGRPEDTAVGDGGHLHFEGGRSSQEDETSGVSSQEDETEELNWDLI